MEDVVDLASPEPGPAALAEAGELRGAVARLPWRERVVVERHYWDGVPLKRVGAALGVSAARATQLRIPAVARLRAMLAP